jgi:hypothetical protein
MKNKLVTLSLGTAVALVFVCGLTFAKSSNLNIIYKGKIANGLTLSPGNYRVVVDNHSATPEVSFYQNGALVGTAPVKIVHESRKNNQTEVYYSAPQDNVRRITQIDFSGWKEKLIFGKTHNPANLG